MTTKPKRRAAHRRLRGDRPGYQAGGSVALPPQPYMDPSHTGGLPYLQDKTVTLPLIDPSHTGGLPYLRNTPPVPSGPSGRTFTPSPSPSPQPGPSITPAVGRRNYAKAIP
jgi:hypothetical protein